MKIIISHSSDVSVDFSALLCMGRCKKSRSIRFFSNITNYLSGLLFQSTELLILFLTLNSLQGTVPQ